MGGVRPAGLWRCVFRWTGGAVSVVKGGDPYVVSLCGCVILNNSHPSPGPSCSRRCMTSTARSPRSSGCRGSSRSSTTRWSTTRRARWARRPRRCAGAASSSAPRTRGAPAATPSAASCTRRVVARVASRASGGAAARDEWWWRVGVARAVAWSASSGGGVAWRGAPVVDRVVHETRVSSFAAKRVTSYAPRGGSHTNGLCFPGLWFRSPRKRFSRVVASRVTLPRNEAN